MIADQAAALEPPDSAKLFFNSKDRLMSKFTVTGIKPLLKAPTPPALTKIVLS